MTADKKQDKILLFKTLNARGIELSQSDLIKNEICSNLKKLTEDEAIYMWDEMRSIIEKNAEIDMFLFHFINSQPDAIEIRKSIENKRNIKTKDLYPSVPEKYTFDVFEEKIKLLNDTEEFLSELKRYATYYVELVKSKDLYLSAIRALNVTKCYPLLLKGKAVLSEKNFILLTKAVECISFRHSMIRSDPKDLEKLYYDVMAKLKSDNDIDVVIDEIKKHTTMKSDEKFKSEFIYASPKSNVSKMILNRIIKKEQEGVDMSSKEVWLEHIMPQTPKGKWTKLYQSDRELYEFSKERLGNLTFIQDKMNINMSNLDFDVKKPTYKKSMIKITAEIANYNEWNFNKIDERQIKLYEKAKDIWKL